MSDVMEDKARFAQGWKGGLPETPCGSGSKMDRTVEQRAWLPRIVRKYGLRTIADIGAGDLNWIRSVPWPPGIEYQAFDLVPRHPDVRQFDLVRMVPPTVDCLLCLWVLNHLPMDDSRAAILNLKASKSCYLIMTDRPKWHHEQPKEILMPAVEELDLADGTGSRMILVDLRKC